MSLDLETRLKTFFASAPQTIHPIETMQISHSAMSQTFHFWHEPYTGVAGGFTMQPANFEVKRAGSPGHLDQKYDIRLGLVDAMDAFRSELDRIPINTTEKISIVLCEYLSDDLTTAESTGILQAESVSWVKGGASISAISPRLNVTRTGELYSAKEISMLRGFL